MTKIVVLGAGVMGSSLAATAAMRDSNDVHLAGSPLDDAIITSLQDTHHHPALDVTLSERLHTRFNSEINTELLGNADCIVIAVSSPGVPWALEHINTANAKPALLSLVTKGLVRSEADQNPPHTYAHVVPAALGDWAQEVVGIGGPCIARELALQLPTRVTFASTNMQRAETLREILQTDDYRVTVTQDVVGLEACAALKNFLCIGVSAWHTRYSVGDNPARNPVAALFNQAVLEMALLTDWIKSGSLQDSAPGSATSPGSLAFDLAGMGDLHVTVGGGRNSRLGHHLGKGERVSSVMAGAMAGITVEGVDTGRQLAGGLHAACIAGTIDAQQLPLTHAILRCIEDDAAFDLAVADLPG